jgi:hypothetical protein
LAVTERVKQAASCIFGIKLERLIKGTAGSQHTKLGVEHYKGLWDGIHNCLRQRLRVFNILKIDHGLIDPIMAADHLFAMKTLCSPDIIILLAKSHCSRLTSVAKFGLTGAA